MDKRVVTLPWVLRFILVYGLIAPFRSKKSAKNYAKIWTKEGSPLLVHSLKLMDTLQEAVAQNIKVSLGMRYGQPSIENALIALADCDDIDILPLYPQYASATNGSSITAVFDYLSKQEHIPNIRIISEFYQDANYIEALKQSIARHLKPDYHLLLSYHGLPEKQLLALGCQKICQGTCTGKIKACYRRQAFETSRLVSQALSLSPNDISVSFQSRLGKTPWIQPFTEDILKTLIDKGIRKLMVACPSFVSDCLETLEEIEIGIKATWYKLGGTEFKYIPCLNEDKAWIDAIVKLINVKE
jgi:ferrochelatase